MYKLATRSKKAEKQYYKALESRQDIPGKTGKASGRSEKGIRCPQTERKAERQMELLFRR